MLGSGPGSIGRLCRQPFARPKRNCVGLGYSAIYNVRCALCGKSPCRLVLCRLFGQMLVRALRIELRVLAQQFYCIDKLCWWSVLVINDVVWNQRRADEITASFLRNPYCRTSNQPIAVRVYTWKNAFAADWARFYAPNLARVNNERRACTHNGQKLINESCWGSTMAKRVLPIYPTDRNGSLQGHGPCRIVLAKILAKKIHIKILLRCMLPIERNPSPARVDSKAGSASRPS